MGSSRTVEQRWILLSAMRQAQELPDDALNAESYNAGPDGLGSRVESSGLRTCISQRVCKHKT